MCIYTYIYIYIVIILIIMIMMLIEITQITTITSSSGVSPTASRSFGSALSRSSAWTFKGQ